MKMLAYLSIVLFLFSFNNSKKNFGKETMEISRNSNVLVTCPAPEEVYVTTQYGHMPLIEVCPSTTYKVYIYTESVGFACFTSTSGFTYSGNGCADVTSGGYYYFYTITTNSSIGSGISMTIQSYCWDGEEYAPGGSDSFFIPSC